MIIIIMLYLTSEYDKVERIFLINEAELNSQYYEEQAEKCLRLIFKDCAEAYAMTLYFANLVDAYQYVIKELKRQR